MISTIQLQDSNSQGDSIRESQQTYSHRRIYVYLEHGGL